MPDSPIGALSRRLQAECEEPLVHPITARIGRTKVVEVPIETVMDQLVSECIGWARLSFDPVGRLRAQRDALIAAAQRLDEEADRFATRLHPAAPAPPAGRGDDGA